MTVDRRNATDAEFQALLTRIEQEPADEDGCREKVARAIADTDDVDWDSKLTERIGTRDWYRRYADAALDAMKAPESWDANAAVQRVEALADELDDRGIKAIVEGSEWPDGSLRRHILVGRSTGYRVAADALRAALRGPDPHTDGAT